MTTLEFYQGDSSGTIEIEVYRNDVKIVDLTGYSGHFVIVEEVGDSTYLLSKAMTVGSDSVSVQITPTESASLPIGTFVGVAQIEGAGGAYRKESQITLNILLQGYNS